MASPIDRSSVRSQFSGSIDDELKLNGSRRRKNSKTRHKKRDKMYTRRHSKYNSKYAPKTYNSEEKNTDKLVSSLEINSRDNTLKEINSYINNKLKKDDKVNKKHGGSRRFKKHRHRRHCSHYRSKYDTSKKKVSGIMENLQKQLGKDHGVSASVVQQIANALQSKQYVKRNSRYHSKYRHKKYIKRHSRAYRRESRLYNSISSKGKYKNPNGYKKYSDEIRYGEKVRKSDYDKTLLDIKQKKESKEPNIDIYSKQIEEYLLSANSARSSMTADKAINIAEAARARLKKYEKLFSDENDFNTNTKSNYTIDNNFTDIYEAALLRCNKNVSDILNHKKKFNYNDDPNSTKYDEILNSLKNQNSDTSTKSKYLDKYKLNKDLKSFRKYKELINSPSYNSISDLDKVYNPKSKCLGPSTSNIIQQSRLERLKKEKAKYTSNISKHNISSTSFYNDNLNKIYGHKSSHSDSPLINNKSDKYDEPLDMEFENLLNRIKSYKSANIEDILINIKEETKVNSHLDNKCDIDLNESDSSVYDEFTKKLLKPLGYIKENIDENTDKNDIYKKIPLHEKSLLLQPHDIALSLSNSLCNSISPSSLSLSSDDSNNSEINFDTDDSSLNFKCLFKNKKKCFESSSDEFLETEKIKSSPSEHTNYLNGFSKNTFLDKSLGYKSDNKPNNKVLRNYRSWLNELSSDNSPINIDKINKDSFNDLSMSPESDQNELFKSDLFRYKSIGNILDYFNNGEADKSLSSFMKNYLGDNDENPTLNKNIKSDFSDILQNEIKGDPRLHNAYSLSLDHKEIDFNSSSTDTSRSTSPHIISSVDTLQIIKLGKLADINTFVPLPSLSHQALPIRSEAYTTLTSELPSSIKNIISGWVSGQVRGEVIQVALKWYNSFLQSSSTCINNFHALTLLAGSGGIDSSEPIKSCKAIKSEINLPIFSPKDINNITCDNLSAITELASDFIIKFFKSHGQDFNIMNEREAILFLSQSAMRVTKHCSSEKWLLGQLVREVLKCTASSTSRLERRDKIAKEVLKQKHENVPEQNMNVSQDNINSTTGFNRSVLQLPPFLLGDKDNMDPSQMNKHLEATLDMLGSTKKQLELVLGYYSGQKNLEVLGISEGHSIADLKKAYRAAALKSHPDKGGDAAKFQEVQVAFEALLEAHPEKDSTDNASKTVDSFPENVPAKFEKSPSALWKALREYIPEGYEEKGILINESCATALNYADEIRRLTENSNSAVEAVRQILVNIVPSVNMQPVPPIKDSIPYVGEGGRNTDSLEPLYLPPHVESILDIPTPTVITPFTIEESFECLRLHLQTWFSILWALAKVLGNVSKTIMELVSTLTGHITYCQSAGEKAQISGLECCKSLLEIGESSVSLGRLSSKLLEFASKLRRSDIFRAFIKPIEVIREETALVSLIGLYVPCERVSIFLSKDNSIPDITVMESVIHSMFDGAELAALSGTECTKSEKLLNQTLESLAEMFSLSHKKQKPEMEEPCTESKQYREPDEPMPAKDIDTSDEKEVNTEQNDTSNIEEENTPEGRDKKRADTLRSMVETVNNGVVKFQHLLRQRIVSNPELVDSDKARASLSALREFSSLQVRQLKRLFRYWDNDLSLVKDSLHTMDKSISDEFHKDFDSFFNELLSMLEGTTSSVGCPSTPQAFLLRLCCYLEASITKQIIVSLCKKLLLVSKKAVDTGVCGSVFVGIHDNMIDAERMLMIGLNNLVSQIE